MKTVEFYIFGTSFIAFLLIIYVVSISFRKKFKQDEMDIYLEVLLFIMLFTLTYYYITYNLSDTIIILTAPILASILYDRKNASVLLTMLMLSFIYSYSINECLIYLALYIIIYFIHRYFNQRTISIKYFVIIYTVLNMITNVITCLLFRTFTINTIISLLLYPILILQISYIIFRVSSLIKTYKTLSELKEDSDLRVNVSKISHEVKNPLVVIKGYLEVLSDKDIIEAKKNLIGQVNYALDILSDFKDLNHLKINKETFLFDEVISYIKLAIIPFYADKEIKTKIDCEKNIYINADKKRIKQVLINIIKNSIESFQDNGLIEITANTINNHLIIKIRDNGKGMDKNTLDNIFVPFYTDKSYGTGIGLCLSKEIIEKHNGSIKYTSKENKYTLVKITLPL